MFICFGSALFTVLSGQLAGNLEVITLVLRLR